MIPMKTSEGGRVVIPADIRRALGIKDGDTVLFEQLDGEARITTREAQLRMAQALVRRYVPEGVSLADELIADRIEALLGSGGIKASAVNYAEAVSKLIDWKVPPDDARMAVASLQIAVVPLDEAQGLRVGQLRSATRPYGLSLGDRACLALAEREQAVVITADRPWLALAESLQLDIRCIRPDQH